MKKALINAFLLYTKAKARGYGIGGLLRLAYKTTNEELDYENHLDKWMDEVADNRGVFERHENKWEELL